MREAHNSKLKIQNSKLPLASVSKWVKVKMCQNDFSFSSLKKVRIFSLFTFRFSLPKAPAFFYLFTFKMQPGCSKHVVTLQAIKKKRNDKRKKNKAKKHDRKIA